MILVVIIAVITLTSAFLIINLKRPYDQTIGWRQAMIFKAYQEGEKALFYIDQSAKYSAQQAVYELGQRGGYENPKCDDYLGYSLWNTETKKIDECFPNYKENFRLHFIEWLNKYLFGYSTIYVTADNYDFILEKNGKLIVKGIAEDTINYEIGRKEDKEEKPKAYTVPENENEIIRKINLVYGNNIKKASLKFFVKESLIAAVIMQESKGNPYAVSSTGCAGVNQFCAATARDYLSIFGTIKTCSKKCSCGVKCTKEQVVKDCGCDINDGRFDAQKSIKAGGEYISKLLRAFKDHPYKEEFAIASYNGGEGVVRNAIKKTGEKFPTWQQVSLQIDDQLIKELYCKKGCSKYFDEVSERKEKVRQIKDYVMKVMSYKIKFEEIDKIYEGITKAEEEEIKKFIEEAKEEPGEKIHDCCICRGGGCGFDCSIESIPSSQYCGFASTGQGKNCDMSYCILSKENLGTYSIKPSFKATLDYDFEEYEEIKKKAKKIVEDCTDDIENCVNKKINIFNDEEILKAREQDIERKYKWSSDCGTEEEKFFYNFVENYKLCLDSGVEEGICEFSFLPLTEKTQTIRISWDKENAKTKIWIENTNFVEPIDAEGPFVFTAGRIEEIDGNKKIVLKGERGDISDERGEHHKDISITFESNPPSYSLLTLSPKIQSDKLILYKGTKNNKPFLSFTNDQVVNNIKSAEIDYPEALPVKYSLIKNTFKFCVNSSKKFHIYDEKTKKTELKKVEYKFALRLIDRKPPPAVEGIEVKDKLKDDNSVIISWDKSTAEDVQEYYIFYSEKDFKDEETKNIINDEKINKIKISEKEKIEIEDIDLSECKFNPIGEPCRYRKNKDSLDYEIQLNKNKLYFIKNKNQYIYVLDDIEDNIQYNFMVVAIDNMGKMIDNNEKKFKLKNGILESAQSKDDLAINSKDLVTEVSYSFLYKRFSFKYDNKADHKNLDGTDADDFDHYDIYYYKDSNLDLEKLRELAGTVPDQTLPELTYLDSFNSDPYKNTYDAPEMDVSSKDTFFFVGIAMDKNGNPGKQIKPNEVGIANSFHKTIP